MADQLLNTLLKGLLGPAFRTGSSHHRRRELVRGDVVCVRNGLFNRYGIWTGEAVITYDKIFKGPQKVHKRSLKDFLHGSKSYSICMFPKTYGRMIKCQQTSPISGVIMPPQKIWRLFERVEKVRRYKRYTPEETADRAEQSLGKTGYASSEHFAVWCKTGISESQEWEALQDLWDKVILY